MRSYPYYPNHQLDIELGSTVQDRISGLTGVVTARVEYLTGCTQYGITPKGDGAGEAPGARTDAPTR